MGRKNLTNADDASLRCSFCHKGKSAAGKLISSPTDYPRAYICDECIAVCAAILADDCAEPNATDRLVEHPMAEEALAALQNWIEMGGERQEAELERIGVLMFPDAAERYRAAGINQTSATV